MKPLICALFFVAPAAYRHAEAEAESPVESRRQTVWYEENSESTDTTKRTARFTVSRAETFDLDDKPACWLYANEDSRFRVLLGPAVIAPLHRIGISSVEKHFQGKQVTIRGQIGCLLPPSIHATLPPSTFLHVDSIENFVSVVEVPAKSATRRANPHYPAYVPFADYPMPPSEKQQNNAVDRNTHSHGN